MDRRAALGLLLVAVACGRPPAVSPDAGAAGAFHLSIDGSPTLGLAYRQTVPLTVLYADQRELPVGGGEVRFQIFGDPAGSTLSRDLVATDPEGRASVDLTAGAVETSFRVVVGARDAGEVELGISVSNRGFVTIVARLVPPPRAPAPARVLRGLLYEGRSCSQLPTVRTPATALRAQSLDGPGPVELRFSSLLAKRYALVGRAEEADGRPTAAACVELAAEQERPGETVSVVVPLAPVRLELAGAWTVTTVVALPPAPALAAWHTLSNCPRAPAQQLLDGLVGTLAPGPLRDGMSARRGAPDGNGCRPAMAELRESLDGQLETLLTPKDAPALQLGALAAALDAITARATVISRLEMVAGEAGLLSGTHTLQQIAFAAAGGKPTVSYDLQALGLPIVRVPGIAATSDGASLGLASHGFTLRMPQLWGRGFADLALAPRGLPITSRGLVTAVVAAAERSSGGQTVRGCAAIQDLVCGAVAVSPCEIVPACGRASDALATSLDAAFTAPVGIDYAITRAGATVIDLDGDLTADALRDGDAAVRIVIAASAPAAAVATPWTAGRAK